MDYAKTLGDCELEMKNQKGFSLIELLIVVVIIGIIAAIAIPNLLAARRSANEGSAVSSLRTIHGANATYQATTGNGNFAPNGNAADQGLDALGDVNLIDATLAQRTKSGYNFTYASQNFAIGTNPATFAVVAAPQVKTGLTMTGTRNFGIATDGVMASQVIATADTMAAAAGSGASPSSYGSAASIVTMGN